jgi:DNA adenine methylase
LKDALCAAVNRGARVVLSNADHKSIHALYKGSGFVTEPVHRASRIAGDTAKRKSITELIILGGFE